MLALDNIENRPSVFGDERSRLLGNNGLGLIFRPNCIKLSSNITHLLRGGLENTSPSLLIDAIPLITKVIENVRDDVEEANDTIWILRDIGANVLLQLELRSLIGAITTLSFANAAAVISTSAFDWRSNIFSICL